MPKTTAALVVDGRGLDDARTNMATGKLAKYQKQARSLRTQNRDLRDEMDVPNPSTLRQLIGVFLRTGVAYGGGRGFIRMQQAGWMPSKIPVDGIVGVAGDIATAFLHDPVSAVFRDIAGGMAEGAAGRMAAIHQYAKGEVDGKAALVLPA